MLKSSLPPKGSPYARWRGKLFFLSDWRRALTTSAVVTEPDCCHHQPRACPKLPQSRPAREQQKPERSLGCAALAPTALAPVAWVALGCYHRQPVDHPKLPRSRRLEWQQHLLRWTRTNCSPTWLLSPPKRGLPQVTTAPPSKMAANAPSVAWICWTRTNCSRTWLLSPPKRGLPQVATEPPGTWSAKASVVEAIFTCCTVASTQCPSRTPTSLNKDDGPGCCLGKQASGSGN